MIGLARVRRVPDRSKIFEQRDDGDLVKASLTQMPRVVWRHRDCRLDDVSKQSKLGITLEHISISRIGFFKKFRRSDVMIDEEFTATQSSQPREGIVTHRMVDQQQITTSGV